MTFDDRADQANAQIMLEARAILGMTEAQIIQAAGAWVRDVGRRRQPDWETTLERAVTNLGGLTADSPQPAPSAGSPQPPSPPQPDTPRTTMPANALRQDRMTIGLLARLTP